jgi:hypothetical protein
MALFNQLTESLQVQQSMARAVKEASTGTGWWCEGQGEGSLSERCRDWAIVSEGKTMVKLEGPSREKVNGQWPWKAIAPGAGKRKPASTPGSRTAVARRIIGCVLWPYELLACSFSSQAPAHGAFPAPSLHASPSPCPCLIWNYFFHICLPFLVEDKPSKGRDHLVSSLSSGPSTELSS